MKQLSMFDDIGEEEPETNRQLKLEGNKKMVEEKVETQEEINQPLEEPKTELNEGESVPYEVGDFVRIQINVTPEEDPETYYYLETYKKKKGTIKEVIFKPRLQYRVLFGDTIVYLYHEEIQ